MRCSGALGFAVAPDSELREGRQYWCRILSAGGLGGSPAWSSSFLYLAFRALLGALVRSRRGLDLKDVELLVLRHELEVLRLRVPETRFAVGHAAVLYS